MGGRFPWYLARSAGMVAWALLTLAVVWGLLMSTKIFGKRPRPAWLLDLHRYLGGLATIFTGVHVAAILLDRYVTFTPVDVLVPFASAWHPGAVAWGVTAMYLLLAVELTSLARARLPRNVWRGVHMASFPLFAVATLHGLTAGTDRHVMVAVSVAIGAVMLVAALSAVRLAEPPTPSRRPVSTGRG